MEFSDHYGIYLELKFTSKSDKTYTVMVEEPMSQRELRNILSRPAQVAAALKWNGNNAFSDSLYVENFKKLRAIRVDEALPSY